MPQDISFISPPYFLNYINLVPDDDINKAYETQQQVVDNFFDDIPSEKHTYAYAPGKWDLKTLLQHITDAERVFNYRVLSISRGEKQNLNGFSENDYAEASDAASKSWDILVKELKAVRIATRLLVENLTISQLEAVGQSNGNRVSVKALAFIIPGHLYHHINIIQERYL
ncbi:MAG: DinB family protein [Ferruginibacter sp.]